MSKTTLILLLVFFTVIISGIRPEPPKELRFMTYNIRAATESSLTQIAEEIESHQPDVVALQEVDVNWGERSNYVDQASFLGKALNMHCFFGEIYALPAAGGRKEMRKYGLALLSKYPVKFRKNHWITRLSSQDESDEAVKMPGLPEIIINVSGRRVHIFNTHLDYRSDPAIRETEATEMLEIINQIDDQDPVVLMGDLNAEPGDPELRKVFDVFGDAWEGQEGEGSTYPADRPAKRIDYILYSSHFIVEKAYVAESQKSDHRPVIGDLILK